MKDKEIKTNAMRLLDKAKVSYTPFYYTLPEGPFSGELVCEILGISSNLSFKTLCACGERKGIAVFVIPISGELDLKAAARSLGDKAVRLVAVKDLLSLTGYERGSVSPVGMKKRYPVFIDASAQSLDTMYISGGIKGITLRLSPDALTSYLGSSYAPLCL